MLGFFYGFFFTQKPGIHLFLSSAFHTENNSPYVDQSNKKYILIDFFC